MISNRADLSRPVNDGPLGVNRFGPLSRVCDGADPAVAVAAGCPTVSSELLSSSTTLTSSTPLVSSVTPTESTATITASPTVDSANSSAVPSAEQELASKIISIVGSEPEASGVSEGSRPTVLPGARSRVGHSEAGDELL